MMDKFTPWKNLDADGIIEYRLHIKNGKVEFKGNYDNWKKEYTLRDKMKQ